MFLPLLYFGLLVGVQVHRRLFTFRLALGRFDFAQNAVQNPSEVAKMTVLCHAFFTMDYSPPKVLICLYRKLLHLAGACWQGRQYLQYSILEPKAEVRRKSNLPEQMGASLVTYDNDIWSCFVLFTLLSVR